MPPTIYVAVHGILYSIPPATTSISNDDLAVDDARSGEGVKWTEGGFRLGSLWRGTSCSYLGPRPVCGHGERRYYYQVIALKEPMKLSGMSSSASMTELLRELDGKASAVEPASAYMSTSGNHRPERSRDLKGSLEYPSTRWANSRHQQRYPPGARNLGGSWAAGQMQNLMTAQR